MHRLEKCFDDFAFVKVDEQDGILHLSYDLGREIMDDGLLTVEGFSLKNESIHKTIC